MSRIKHIILRCNVLKLAANETSPNKSVSFLGQDELHDRHELGTKPYTQRISVGHIRIFEHVIQSAQKGKKINVSSFAHTNFRPSCLPCQTCVVKNSIRYIIVYWTLLLVLFCYCISDFRIF